MGRPLFSKTYASKPAVHTQPEPIVDPICHKWSLNNTFDPDSDEFFVDAQYEAFLDPAALRLVPTEVIEPAEADSSSDSSSDSSTDASTETGVSSDSAASPMATGPDDPAVLIADAYLELSADEWSQRLRASSSAASEWLDTIAVTTPLLSRIAASDINSGSSREGHGEIATSTSPPTRSYRPNRPRSASAAAPALVPLSALLREPRSSERSNEEHLEQLSSSVPETAATILDTTTASNTQAPALVPDSIATPTPVDTHTGAAAPITPQRRTVRGATQTIFTPSPPPSVTPRYYSWQNHPIPAIPTSPTTVRGAHANRDVGPLTNPHARRSFARLGPIVPVSPALMSNTVN